MSFGTKLTNSKRQSPNLAPVFLLPPKVLLHTKSSLRQLEKGLCHLMLTKSLLFSLVLAPLLKIYQSIIFPLFCFSKFLNSRINVSFPPAAPAEFETLIYQLTIVKNKKAERQYSGSSVAELYSTKLLFKLDHVLCLLKNCLLFTLLVNDQNNYFGSGPIPKPKMADTAATSRNQIPKGEI